MRHAGFHDAMDIIISSPGSSHQLLELLLGRFCKFCPKNLAIHPPVVRRWLSGLNDSIFTQDTADHAGAAEAWIGDHFYLAFVESFINDLSQGLR